MYLHGTLIESQSYRTDAPKSRGAPNERAMRSKESCSSRTLDVNMRVTVDCSGQQTLVWELIKHLLYMRNQIPGLYEDLEWQVQVRAEKHSQFICMPDYLPTPAAALAVTTV